MTDAEVTIGEREPESTPDVAGDVLRKQVRGSSLLIAGRFLALGINFVIQLMIVRYLSKEGYGAFAYVLALGFLGETIVLFGLDRAVSRSIPIFLEKRDYGSAFGTLALSIGIVVAIGASFVLTLVAIILSGRGGAIVADSSARHLLLIMAPLAPLLAIDDLLRGVFSVLGRPKTFFFRAYVVEPGFRVLVVALLIVSGSDVYFLGAGYVAAQALGLVIAGILVVRVLREEGLLRHLRVTALRFPLREVLLFTMPLFSTDLVNVLMFSMDTLLLGHFKGTEAVAGFRVVIPVVWLNMLPQSCFAILYVPLATRLFAREDFAALKELYSRTTVWVALISFPIFAATFLASRPITLSFYGSRYADSAVILTILAVGYYAQGAFGANGLTMIVYRRVRDLTLLNLGMIVFNLALSLELIPRYGAIGAAFATSITLVVYNIVKQIMLRRTFGLTITHATTAKPLLTLGLCFVILTAAFFVIDRSSYLVVALALVTSVAILVSNRGVLEFARMFPELERLPLVRRIATPGRGTS
jgi:O-antigen/teichoic acid export membrane protein